MSPNVPLLTYTPPGGSPLDLNDYTTYLLVALRNAGLAGVDQTIERTPRRRGATYVRSVLAERFLDLEIVAGAASWTALQAVRQALVAALSPEDGLGVLTYTPAGTGGQAYAIDCVYDAGAEFSRPIGDGAEELYLTLRCPDPAWYDPVAKTQAFAVPDAGLDIDLNIDLDIDPHYVSAAVAYGGTTTDRPSWSVPGPFTGLVLTNVTAGKELRIPSLTVPSGSTLVVDMDARIVEVDGANRLSSMDAASAFWALEAGSNTIKVRTVAGHPTATLTYYNRYAGI